MDLEAVIRKIDERLAVIGKRAATASREAGLSPDAIRNMRRAVKSRSGAGVSMTTIAALAPILQTSAAWLIGTADEPGAEGYVVPLLSWVSAGDMMREDVADDILGRIHVTDLPPGDWIALEVRGDSMDRISPPESKIFVDRRDKRLVPNGLYVIADDDGNATYKRYRPGPPMRFEPVSTNPAHEPIFPEREPLVVGRVKRSVLDVM
jgi:SOS-response transcriptional repressor LexA